MKPLKAEQLTQAVTNIVSVIKPKTIEHLAHHTGFIQRRGSKVKGFTYLLAVLAALASMAPSLESICSKFRVRISRQAIHQRFNRHSVAFLKACLELLLQKISCSELADSSASVLFSRILVCDSTHWKVSDKLARAFRGFGGGASKACCKLQTVIEPLSGKLVHWRYMRAASPDQGYSKQLPKLLKPQDLLLMDLGYYAIKTFKRIEQRGAFFITRVYYNSVVKTLSAKSVKTTVAGLLKKFSDPLVDLQLAVGAEQSMQLRLVAVKLSAEKAQAQRRKVLEDYRKKGRTPSQDKLQSCDWNILITNIQPSLFLTAEEIVRVYGTRWQIEIFFRDAKSLLKLNVCRSGMKSRFEVELLATLFLASLLFFLYGCFNNRAHRKQQEVSFDKLIKRFSDLAALFIRFLLQQTASAFKQAVNLLLKLPQNSIKFHQSTRKTPRENLKSCGLA